MPPVKNRKTQPKKNLAPQPLPDRSPSNGSSAIIIVVIVIIIVAVAVFYFFDKNRTKNLLNDDGATSNQYSTTLNEDAPKDPYSGWNEYKNASGTLEIKYPVNWSLKKENGIAKLVYPDSTTTEFIIDYKTTDKNLSQYLTDLDKIAATGYEGKSSVDVKDQKEITVNGFQSIQRSQFLNAAGLNQIITYVYDQGKVATFSMVYDQITDDWLQAYNLILNSFKFLPQSAVVSSSSTVATASSSTSSTSSTLNYKNSVYGFNLSYDSNLKPKTDSSGINFNKSDKEYLKITGFNSSLPSLVDYHPNGANVSGQLSIGGKSAMKFSTTKDNLTYVQCVLVLNSKNWLKIEYQAGKDNQMIFDKIISSIKF